MQSIKAHQKESTFLILYLQNGQLLETLVEEEEGGFCITALFKLENKQDSLAYISLIPIHPYTRKFSYQNKICISIACFGGFQFIHLEQLDNFLQSKNIPISKVESAIPSPILHSQSSIPEKAEAPKKRKRLFLSHLPANSLDSLPFSPIENETLKKKKNLSPIEEEENQAAPKTTTIVPMDRIKIISIRNENK